MAIDIYLHDSPETFRIVLRGGLAEAGAHELKWAWETAKSVLTGKEVVVEVSQVSAVDIAGLDLLSSMRDSGVRISASRLPECEDLIRRLDLRGPRDRPASGRRPWILRLLRV